MVPSGIPCPARDDPRSGCYNKTLLAACTPGPELDAHIIHDATSGWSANAVMVDEVLCVRSRAEIRDVCAAYQALYGEDMLASLKGATTGGLKKTYTAIIATAIHAAELSEAADGAAAPEAAPSDAEVMADVELIYKAGEGKWGTDEQVFIAKLAGSPRAYRNRLFDAYQRKHKKGLDNVIHSEISGAFGSCLAQLVTPVPSLLAAKLYKAMHGIGTNDAELIRIVCGQRGHHLAATAKSFAAKYGKSLCAWIESDCSGEYQRLLCAIVQQALTSPLKPPPAGVARPHKPLAAGGQHKAAYLPRHMAIGSATSTVPDSSVAGRGFRGGMLRRRTPRMRALARYCVAWPAPAGLCACL